MVMVSVMLLEDLSAPSICRDQNLVNGAWSSLTSKCTMFLTDTISARFSNRLHIGKGYCVKLSLLMGESAEKST